MVLSRPFRLWKALLVGSMVALAALAFITPLGQSFFNFSLTPATLWTSLAVGAVGARGDRDHLPHRTRDAGGRRRLTSASTVAAAGL